MSDTLIKSLFQLRRAEGFDDFQSIINVSKSGVVTTYQNLTSSYRIPGKA